MITANSFFGHWIKDIDVRRYPDDTKILPTNDNVDVYQYSASQLKYLPKNAISTIEKMLLYSKKPVYLDVDVDRRSNNNNDQTKRTDDNLDYMIGIVQRNMNKLFETKAKTDSISDEPNALIRFHDWPCIAYQEINLTETFDIYLRGV